MYHHTYVYTSSRGRNIDGQINCRKFTVVPGGKFQKLGDIAFKDLNVVDGVKLVYFIAGIPDICTLVRKSEPKYEESFVKKTVNGPIDHVDRVREIIRDTKTKLTSIGCKVVFATIATSSIREWNYHRRSINKTTYLKYTEKYGKMQEELNFIVNEINNFITELNCMDSVVTPFFHSPVHKCKNGKVRYLYNRFVDGVHPGSELERIWVERLLSAIHVNEQKFV